MIKKYIYNRKLSEIEFLQKNRTIEYSLSEIDSGNGKIYGVVLSELCDDFLDKEESYIISLNRVLVENVLKYLYENCIRADNLKDIIEDIMDKISTRENERSVFLSN
ncbi:MAG: DUF6514 family protein [Oscillospiraceae bacterium]|jgi:hypothetical protein|nr:DUF6514 family protein [Oscillospiraceae bacterium]